MSSLNEMLYGMTICDADGNEIGSTKELLQLKFRPMTQDEIKKEAAKRDINLLKLEIEDLDKYIELTKLFKYLFREVRNIDHNSIIDASSRRIERCNEIIVSLEKQLNQTK